MKMFASSIKLILFGVIILTVSGQNDDLIVQLPNGKIRGHFLKSLTGKKYYAFQDIPYAAPPIGELRYKESRSPDPWEGILNTTNNVKQCPQEKEKNKISSSSRTENEDCLYISVYSPQKPGCTDLLPVLFWIHGGGFSVGSGSINLYNPARFIDHNILVVTFNYRLGALGFLTTEDGVIPGNLGLKDQAFAMKWVNTNIHLFGGDPEKVTIMGESAGAHAVGYHLISNRAGLFRGVIQDSGTSIGQMAYAANPRANAFTLGRILDANFTSDDSNDLLQLLKRTSADDIVKAAAEVVPFDPNTAGYCTRHKFIPVLENKNDRNVLVTVPMHQTFIDGTFYKVPMLVGFNSQEALFFIDERYDYLASEYDKDPSLMVEKIWNVSPEKTSILGREFRKIYTNSSFSEDKAAFVKYSSDAGYTTGVIRQAQLASKYVPVYLYQFSYEGQLGLIVNPRRYAVPGAEGVSHAEELIYLWKLTPIFNSRDQLTSQRVVTMWTNFVKYQNPTPQPDKAFINIRWPKVKADSDIQYLDIDVDLEVKTNPRFYRNISSLLLQYLNPPYIVF